MINKIGSVDDIKWLTNDRDRDLVKLKWGRRPRLHVDVCQIGQSSNGAYVMLQVVTEVDGVTTVHNYCDLVLVERAAPVVKL